MHRPRRRHSRGARGRVRGSPFSGPAADTLQFLRALDGTLADRVLALAQATSDLARPLSSRRPELGAQVIFGVRVKHCVRISDFIRRRTLLGASADQGWDAAPRVAALMAAELGWSSERTATELEDYRREIDSNCAFREER